MSMETKDLSQENIIKLTTLFPELITEVEREGKVVKAVNVETLKNLVGDFADGSNEFYELNWVGKQESRQKIVMPINKTLRPVIKDSVDFENTENLYIEGDNFEVLKLLQESYLNKIKMIYIDPPYNTGKDFVYKDNFAMSRGEYDDETGAIDEDGNKLFLNTTTNGRFHSDWLSMMFERLVIAKDLLRDDGVIFVSIDDNEAHNLQNMMNEVFGEENFLGQVSRATGTPTGQGTNGLVSELDYIIIYSKSEIGFISGLPFSDSDRSIYNQEDENGKYLTRPLRKTGGEDKREDRPSMYFALISPDKKEVYPIGPGGYESRWRCSLNKFKEFTSHDLIEWKQIKENDELVWKPYLKFYLEGRLKQPSNLWQNIEGNKKASVDLRKMFGEKLFDFPKPVELIKRCIQIASDNGDLILDFFSGSATTAHAVMQLNAEDGGNRKFIMVQLPEQTAEDSEAFKAGYKNICEIGKERIRRAAKKIKEENNDKDLLNVDFGFRVFKLDSSNMKDIYYNPKDIDQKTLTNFRDNIKEGRTDKDLLYQVLLEMAVPISAKIKEETVNNKTVYLVNDDFLVACFDDDVDLEMIKEIAEFKPLRFVFKDSSFKDDAAKVNCDEYLMNKLPSTIVKVI